ncbi:MAG: histidinol-phosphate transaminase [Verrucomicrobiae bacterium]|nr:histidinol-phosphate transaminase [Verrucomicrobiae bacterium]
MQLNKNLENQINPQLRSLEVYEIGKPIDETARELGLDPKTIVKLASNENPLGPSPKAVAAMREAVAESHLYPDGHSYHLTQALSQKFNVPMNCITLGNGSNEIIELLGHAFLNHDSEVVISRHAFLVYKLMAQLFGAKCIEVPDQNFQHDLIAMRKAITPKTKLVIVANPNNPTGTWVDAQAIDDFVHQLPPHVIAVFDEAYYEFMTHPPDCLRYVREGKNVVVMRTFSKSQGLAGLRIGYGFTPNFINSWLQRSRQPFNVNAIAQAGASASLLDEEHQQATRKIVDEGRKFLENAFQQLKLSFVPACANFILVKVGQGKECFKKLLAQGVIVRAMDAYQLPDYIRVSIGTPDQNQRFVSALKKISAP